MNRNREVQLQDVADTLIEDMITGIIEDIQVSSEEEAMYFTQLIRRIIATKNWQDVEEEMVDNSMQNTPFDDTDESMYESEKDKVDESIKRIKFLAGLK